MEPPCVAVVGASGVVFGMAGSTVADMILNFDSLARPVLRSVILLAFLVFFVVTVGTTPNGTSHMSHVGGFAGGLLGGLVLLAGTRRGRREAVAAAVGAVGCLVIYLAMPLIFYLGQLPGVCCGCSAGAQAQAVSDPPLGWRR